MSDALLLLLRVNLAAAVAVAVVMALRLPARRLFGAGAAYGLWSLAPLAALAMILPVRVVTEVAPAAARSPAVVWNDLAAGPEQLSPGPDWTALLVLIWILGGLLSLYRLARRQGLFERAVRAGRAGPAVLGVLRPRIVTPDDFLRRYTERERTVVLAHERVHIARHDSRINAAVAVARCVSWFNPLVHVLAHYLRIDQELACDAAVIAAHPAARRSYAEALLKTQLAARPLPLGCYWPAQSAHPLAQRIALLARGDPGRTAQRLGAAAVIVLALGGGCIAWAARPPRIVETWAPVPPPPASTAAAEAPAAPDRRPTHARPAAPAPAPIREPAAGPAPTPSEPAAAADTMSPPATPVPTATAWTPGAFPSGEAFGGPLHPRRVKAASQLSVVEPGSAVRVLATMVDPDQIPLTTDLTAFGSQSLYRVGYIWRGRSRYKLFTSVVQHGRRLLVTASLSNRFAPWETGSIELASGETGTIVLDNGQRVTVTPTLRPETEREMAEGRLAMERPGRLDS